jgi:hypothetical protein
MAIVTSQGQGFSIKSTLTVTNGVYTIGDCVGGVITLAGISQGASRRSVIDSIVLSGVAALDYNLFLFSAALATPPADNDVGTMVAADIANCKGVLTIRAADYLAPVSAFNVATKNNVGLVFNCTNTTLYGYLIAVATTTPGTTTLTITISGHCID